MKTPLRFDAGSCVKCTHLSKKSCNGKSLIVSDKCNCEKHHCDCAASKCACEANAQNPSTCKDVFRKAVKFVAKWLVEWNEFWGIPLGLLLFALSPRLLSWIEPTAGSYDIVILQPLLYSVAALWFLKGMCWLLLRFDFPVVYRWLDNKLGEEFARLPRSHKMVFAAGIFSFYLTLLVVLTVILL